MATLQKFSPVHRLANVKSTRRLINPSAAGKVKPEPPAPAPTLAPIAPPPAPGGES